MYRRSPPPSASVCSLRYKRRTSAYHNNSTSNIHRESLSPTSQICENRCRCCSMSTGDLIANFDHVDDECDDDGSSIIDDRDVITPNLDNSHFWPPDVALKNSDSMNGIAFRVQNSQNNYRRTNVNSSRSSRTPSIVSTLSSPNILLAAEQTISNDKNRLRERMTASIAGLKELDILREKHRRMVKEVKAQLKTSTSTAVANNAHFNNGCDENAAQQRQQTATLVENVVCVGGHNNNTFSSSTAAARSPSPVEFSSNISHRSSLSMDSGVCLSLTSDPAANVYYQQQRPAAANGHYYHQRHFSTDSAGMNNYSYVPSAQPTRKSSWTTYDSTTTTSDDEGCYAAQQDSNHASTLHQRQNYQPSFHGARTHSLASITSALAAAEATAAPRPPPLRYRRRGGMGGNFVNARPKSLYNCYPEENTVVVESPPPPLGDNTSYYHQEPRLRIVRRGSVQCAALTNCNSRTSIACAPEYDAMSVDEMMDTVQPRRHSTVGAQGRRSVVDPVFRASRVFIHTLPENDVIINNGAGHEYYGAALRPRRYETRRPRPTSMAVPSSMDVRRNDSFLRKEDSFLRKEDSFLRKEDSFLRKESSYTDNGLLEERCWSNGNSRTPPSRRTSNFTWDEVKRLLDPGFATRSSSSTTLVRQHSTASVNNAAGGRQSSSSPVNNISIVSTNGDSAESSTGSGVSSTDGSYSPYNGRSSAKNGHGASQEHAIVSRSVSSQSTDSNKSKRKDKTWHESVDL